MGEKKVELPLINTRNCRPIMVKYSNNQARNSIQMSLRKQAINRFPLAEEGRNRQREIGREREIERG